MALDTVQLQESLGIGRWDKHGDPVDAKGHRVTGPRVLRLASDHEEKIAAAKALGLQVVDGRMRVDKRWCEDFSDEQLLRGQVPEPYEIVESINLLLYGGASCLWECLIGNGTASAGQALTYFNNAQAAIGVGDSATAAAAGQTDLQAATNKLRKAMVATYPQHTDGVIVGAATIVYQSSFGSAEANWAWAEWGLFNSATLATGRMFDRVVAANGTKASGSVWTATATLSLA